MPEFEGRHLLNLWWMRSRLTQEEAAERLGMQRVQLNRFLNGTRRPGLDAAFRIEDRTGVPARSWTTARQVNRAGSYQTSRAANEAV